MTLLRKSYSPGIEGGGIPDEDSFQMTNEERKIIWVNSLDSLNDCFNDYEDQLARLKEENERLRGEGWVSVEDRLPEDKGLVAITVLTINKGLHIDCLHYWKGDWYKDHVLDTTQITHWQPLPSYPTTSPTKK